MVTGAIQSGPEIRPDGCDRGGHTLILLAVSARIHRWQVRLQAPVCLEKKRFGEQEKNDHARRSVHDGCARPILRQRDTGSEDVWQADPRGDQKKVLESAGVRTASITLISL